MAMETGSTLAQVMACCLTAPSHYLNQCWLIICKIQSHSSDGNFTRDISSHQWLKFTWKLFISNVIKISQRPMSNWSKVNKEVRTEFVTCHRSCIFVMKRHPKISLNSFSPGGFDYSLKLVNFKVISTINILSVSCEIAIRWIPQHPTDH